jgi:SNF2 family DNA or RNA helicase
MGQTRPVTVVDLITSDTTDETVLKRLDKKTDQQARALGRAGLRGLV